MKNPIIALLGTRRFLPLFITQFLGAFNDNLFRSAIIMLITFGMLDEMAASPAVMNNVAIGLFILPYFIFSALAGQLADKFEKSRQIVWIKLWEVALMVIGALGFYYSSLPLLIIVLSGLGLQSTFFGPIKYGILPDLMKPQELLSANALIEAGTFIAILLGTIIGGLLMASGNGVFGITALTILAAVVGVFSGKSVPKGMPAAPDLTIKKNIFASTGEQLKKAMSVSVTRRTIIGISWIWMYGSIYITQIPVVAKEHLHGDETVVTLFMACFTFGIGIGSMLCSKLLKGRISAKLAKPALLWLFGLGVLLFALLPTKSEASTLLDLTAFMAIAYNWLILAVLLLTAMLAGLIIVPMYAILQDKAKPQERSRMIAANNIVNSGFMAGGSIIASLIIAFGFSTIEVLFILGLANLLIIPSVDKLHKTL